jgi:hypothetical protein
VVVAAKVAAVARAAARVVVAAKVATIPAAEATPAARAAATPADKVIPTEAETQVAAIPRAATRQAGIPLSAVNLSRDQPASGEDSLKIFAASHSLRFLRSFLAHFPSSLISAYRNSGLGWCKRSLCNPTNRLSLSFFSITPLTP